MFLGIVLSSAQVRGTKASKTCQGILALMSSNDPTLIHVLFRLPHMLRL